MRHFFGRSTLVLSTLCMPALPGGLWGQERHPPVQAMVPAIEQFVERAFGLNTTPGLGVAVVVDGRTVFQRGLGFADADAGVRAGPETLWYLASTSKSLTGFGVALLEARGELNLRAPITQILPNAKWHPQARPEELDLISFVTHTHGLNSGAVVNNAAFTGAVEEGRWPELLAYSEPLASRDLAYSNLGYNVAAMAIDARRPEGWKAFLDREVFRPAGLMDTRASFAGIEPSRVAQPHRLRPDGSFESLAMAKRDVTMNAAGGHVATTGDLARWVTMHMDGGVLDGRPVFPEAVVRRTHQLLARRDLTFAFFRRDGWGIGWDIGAYEGDSMVSRFGSYASYRSHVSFLPQRRVGVVAMVNGRPGWALTDIIAAFVYDLAAGRVDARARGEARLQELAAALQRSLRQTQEAVADRATRDRPLPRPLGDYAGTYQLAGYGRIGWRVEGNQLWVRWGVLEGRAQVHDASTNQVRVPLRGGEEIVQFVFEGEGPARAMRIDDLTFMAER